MAGAEKVYLAWESTHCTDPIERLVTLVSETFALNAFAPRAPVFCNWQRDRVKILEWAHSGFWVYRQLERRRFVSRW
jgi:transposase